MTTMTNQMNVTKTAGSWKLTCGAWGVTLVRSAATDAILTGCRTATYTMVTKDVSVSMATRTGTHTSTRTEVVSRTIETTRGTLAVTAAMVRI